MDGEEIVEYLDELKVESVNIYKDLVDICLYMNGAMSWTEVQELSIGERKIMVEKITDYNKNQSR